MLFRTVLLLTAGVFLTAMLATPPAAGSKVTEPLGGGSNAVKCFWDGTQWVCID